MVKRVHFILASNTANSITRVVAEYANQLASRGYVVTITYPFFSFWDHHRWCADKKLITIPFFQGAYRIFNLNWLTLKVIIRTLLQGSAFRWQGLRMRAIDPRIHLNRIWAVPHAHNVPDSDVVIVMQNYLIPRLLFLPSQKGKIIGSVHMDYQQMIRDVPGISTDWWQQFLLIDQRLQISRFAVSLAAKQSAESLGVAVQAVVNNGINLNEFTCNRTKKSTTALRVMLFCATLPPKGQDFGCRVVQALKNKYPSPQINFVSIGEVKKEHQKLFDENLGYLHGQEYVRAYQDCDIFIYPSLRDGFPAPPLEAMACGAVLVTTAVGGVVEYGVHQGNCLMSAPNDVPTMVANIEWLIQDAPLRVILQREGLRTAQSYTWAASTLRLEAFINDVATLSYPR